MKHHGLPWESIEFSRVPKGPSRLRQRADMGTSRRPMRPKGGPWEFIEFLSVGVGVGVGVGVVLGEIEEELQGATV